jgi:hypothetical protein
MTIKQTLNGAAIFILWGAVAFLIWWIMRKIFGVI